MSRALNGPIPGQSLTDEPSNYAWERPPETADPTEALSMHLKKMAGPKYMDSALYMMELGVPADVITNTTLTMAIGNGIHSVDVGLIIAPAIHKEVVSIAEMAGIDYDEHFPEDAEKEQINKYSSFLHRRIKIRAPYVHSLVFRNIFFFESIGCISRFNP